MKPFILQNRWYILINLICLILLVGSIWLMVRPVERPHTVSSSDVAQARGLALQWLKNNFSAGLFAYEFSPEKNTTPNSSNALRQLMGSRVAAEEAAYDEAMYRIHKENLAFVIENWFTMDGDKGYVYFKDKSKLGANAMLLRTIVYSPDFEFYTDEAAAIACGIIALQQADGSFEPWYVKPNYAYDAEYLLYFYSGEAILALVEYYEKTGDETVLLAVKKAAEYYLVAYVDMIGENYHPAYVPWHTMAYTRLYALTGDVRYRDAIYTMNDRLITLLDTTVRPGRFYKKELEAEGQVAPHSSSDAVYLEGLLYAYELAVELGEGERAEQYLEAIELSTARLVALQYQEKIDNFKAPIETYVGAIPVSETRSSIRVDTTQHTLDAFAKYLSLFGEKG